MKHLIWTITLVLSLVMGSCQTDLDMKDIIDQNSSFTLIIRTVDKETGLSKTETEEIEVNSVKWNKLIDFAKNNIDHWQSSPASYIGNIYVTQNDFRLIYTKGTTGTVITFMDKEGEPKQYIKKIEKGELDFLTE